MAEIRRKTDSDDVAKIIAIATEDLRRVYQRATRFDGNTTTESVHTSLVAIENKVIVGIVEYYENKTSLYIQGLAVHPQHRRCGIAKALIREVEAIAAGKGMVNVSLSTIKETGNPKFFE